MGGKNTKDMKKLVLTSALLAFLFVGIIAVNSVVAVTSDVSDHSVTAVYDDPPKKAAKTTKATKKCCSQTTKCSSKSAKAEKCDDKATSATTAKDTDKKEDTDKK